MNIKISHFYKIANLVKYQQRALFIHKHVGEWHLFWGTGRPRKWAAATAAATINYAVICQSAPQRRRH